MKYNPSRAGSAHLSGAEEVEHQPARIPLDGILLAGELSLVPKSKGIVLFAHGSGSTRHSPRNQFVAGVIQSSGTSTLLFDLLTPEEDAEDDSHSYLDAGHDDRPPRRAHSSLLMVSPLGSVMEAPGPTMAPERMRISSSRR